MDDNQQFDKTSSTAESNALSTNTAAEAADPQSESASLTPPVKKAVRARRKASAPVQAPAPSELAVPDAIPADATDTGSTGSPAADTAANGTTGSDGMISVEAPVKKAPIRRSRAKKVLEPAAGIEPETSSEAGIAASAPYAASLPSPEAAAAAQSVADSAPTDDDGSAGSAADLGISAAPAAPKKAPRRRASAKAASPASEVPAESVPEVQAAAVPEASVPAASVAAASGTPAAVTASDPLAPAASGAEGTASSTRQPRQRRQSRAKVQASEQGAAAAATAAEPLEQMKARSQESHSVNSEAAGTEVAGGATAEDAQPVTAGSPQAPVLIQQAPGLSVLFQAPDLSAAIAAAPAVAAAAQDDDDENGQDDGDGETGRRRRRNRGRRGRSGADSQSPDAGRSQDETDQDESSDDEDNEAGNDTGSDGVTSRRRRRRRRGEQDLELSGGNDDDPPNTVTRVRAPRQASEAPVSNKVTSLRGSTRLEAKKQRRRDSRDTGRRRQVITEAEFLARRESVDRTMVVRQQDDRIQIGVLEDGILAEHFVSKTQQDSLIGNVYLGKVQNVLPSMEAAFVDIGRGRNAVLYAGEVNWDAANLNGQPRRIEHALKSGDSVLVQVSKDPVGHKGARLTSQISLPGRYLVYVPGGSMTGISRKLPDVERNRLKRILKDHLPEHAGVIVRTAAEGASEEELTHDINRLRAQWEGIQAQTTSTKVLSPEMLYGEPDLTIKVVRDVFNEDFSKLIVSGEEAWDTIEAYVTYVAPDLLDRLEKWTNDEDIFAAHRIDEQISKALERKVFLPSGGSLVIDRTEAMTVVDVNTGKFTGSGGNLEETVTKNNLEAAEEVVRQLRLRDIGGIIVIDFIDMVLESNRDLVLRRLVECLGRDRTKHQVAEVTSLGLIQMTRKRMGTGLLEVFGEQCEACAGRGVVTHEIPVEHRRVHTIAAEQHHPQPRADQSRPESGRPARSEKKRNRGRSASNAEQSAAESHGQGHGTGNGNGHDELSEAERQAKASAARAALATIAAATHAPHSEEARSEGHPEAGAESVRDSRFQQQQQIPADQPTGASASSAGRADEPTTAAQVPAAGSSNAVLTIGGESIELPRAVHQEVQAAVDPSRTLAGLSQALDQLADGVDVHQADHSGLDAQGQPQVRARRGRRNRAASRPQGAANTNEVQPRAAEPELPRGGHEHLVIPAKPEQAPKSSKAVKPTSEPLILGVGVPASEL
ncbi:Rne/Rng family ribonuclease [Paenarthrobacter sp. Z7-10]|uniref:Rne/Rng family ribonuclease n=1 Tax=Paenarthrobacter sp. Z7-10 TaxID=2787635 RepID=UPI0022A8E8E0|nr:Rne/Rng family ribonuclease [Paenarthrobacter sp. Z7-10]MCZ2403942.1 Rne/Rng family ribonuclease [Paenarthrobacter sp. Z7-10]